MSLAVIVEKKHSFLLVLPYVALAVLLLTTDPLKLPLIILFVPFILIFLVIYMPVNLLLKRNDENGGSWGQRKRTVMAVSVAAVPTAILLLSSINQLTLKDIVLWVILAVAVVIYASRANFLIE